VKYNVHAGKTYYKSGAVRFFLHFLHLHFCIIIMSLDMTQKASRAMAGFNTTWKNERVSIEGTCISSKTKLRVLNVCDECLNIRNRHVDIGEERQGQTERVRDEHTMAAED